MTGVRGVAVVVPAHDEQDLVDGCLDAVAAALATLAAESPHVRGVVVVALDSCVDATAARVAAHGVGAETVVLGHRCVGAARAAGTAHALAVLGLPADLVWTAHTDADSRVPATWLRHGVDAARAGADALVGTVVPGDGLRPTVRELWGTLHPPVVDHPYVHGANLGVRASALAAVGGWRELAVDEDVDLVDRLRAHGGLDVRTTTAAPVVTSARERGRAPDGFARYLRDLRVLDGSGQHEGLTAEAG